MNHPALYVQNTWLNGSGECFSSCDPATGELLWKGFSADQANVDQAVAAAQTAKSTWAQLTLEARSLYLQAFATELKNRQTALAKTISSEVGKPLWESLSEVAAMIQKVAISIEAQLDRCRTREYPHPLGIQATRHRPHGVVAIFGPFNFPGHLPNGHIVPALLAGNTVVFKPSECAPLVAEEIIRCWEKASLPSGVLNMVQGGKNTGICLANHPNIDGIFFTGSYSTGKQLSSLFAADPGKILALEMGGNNPLIVDEISDFEAAAYTIIQSAYLTSGQRCTCARRLIILEKQIPLLLPALISQIKKIRVGHYTEQPEPFMGPVISSKTAKNLLLTQEQLIQKNSTPLIPMSLLKPNTGLLSPGLLDVTEATNIPDEEIFGPLLQIVRVQNFKEAIVEANKTTYGLAAGLLSESKEHYEDFLQNIKAGIVNWNVPLTGASSSAPFGGVGRSGNHRPSAYYAADYCSYPVASIEEPVLKMPKVRTPGLE